MEKLGLVDFNQLIINWRHDDDTAYPKQPYVEVLRRAYLIYLLTQRGRLDVLGKVSVTFPFMSLVSQD